jgi:DUF917 family protein
MGRHVLQTEQECEDLIRGCLLMGTGGGGQPEWGRRMLKGALEEGITVQWVDVDDIPDDAWTVTAFGMGSIAPMTQETEDEIERIGLEDKFGDNSIGEAIKELGEYLGAPIRCLVPTELGAGNTPAPLVTGARLGISVVDGDYAGRAIPEEMQGTPFLYGKNSWPFSSVDKWGNVAIVKRTANPQMVERIGKMLAVAAYGHTTMAATPLRGREMKEIVVRGTLTRCLALGRAIREAREKGADPVDAALQVTGGWRLFEGTVSGKDWEDRGGYMYGTTHIQGTGEYQGQTLDVWFKNENHVSWLNGQPWVCSPDVIAIVYADTAEGITNTDIAAGQQVAVLGIKGQEIFRTEFGLNESSGPRYFGFDIDYVPIEELMGARG